MVLMSMYQVSHREVEFIVQKAIDRKSQTVNLGHRQLTVLPDALKKLVRVERLLLNDNRIIMPPLELLSLKSLKELSLDHNQLTVLPTGFGNLKNLRVLCLSHNNIGFLPSELGELTLLKELWVTNTQLMCLPPEICKIKTLEKLGAAHNMLTRLPDKMHHIQSLKWLNLRDNQLNELPDDFSKLSELGYLDLSENRFDCFPNLSGLAKLEFLSVKANKLKTISEQSFKNLENLTKVDLQDNEIEMLPRCLEKLRIFVTGTSTDEKSLDVYYLDQDLVTNMRKRQRGYINGTPSVGPY